MCHSQKPGAKLELFSGNPFFFAPFLNPARQVMENQINFVHLGDL